MRTAVCGKGMGSGAPCGNGHSTVSSSATVAAAANSTHTCSACPPVASTGANPNRSVSCLEAADDGCGRWDVGCDGGCVCSCQGCRVGCWRGEGGPPLFCWGASPAAGVRAQAALAAADVPPTTTPPCSTVYTICQGTRSQPGSVVTPGVATAAAAVFSRCTAATRDSSRVTGLGLVRFVKFVMIFRVEGSGQKSLGFGV